MSEGNAIGCWPSNSGVRPRWARRGNHGRLRHGRAGVLRPAQSPTRTVTAVSFASRVGHLIDDYRPLAFDTETAPTEGSRAAGHLRKGARIPGRRHRKLRGPPDRGSAGNVFTFSAGSLLLEFHRYRLPLDPHISIYARPAGTAIPRIGWSHVLSTRVGPPRGSDNSGVPQGQVSRVCPPTGSYWFSCSPVTRKITRRPTTTVWSPKRS